MFGQPMAPVTARDAETLALELFNLKVTAHPLAGERDFNFCLVEASGRKLVLKVVHPDESLATIQFQNSALQHIAAHSPDLPVPRVLQPSDNSDSVAVWRTDDCPDRGVQCLSFLEGHSLHLVPGSATQRRNLGAIQARMNQALSGFSHTAENRDVLWDTKRADRLGELSDFVCDPTIRNLAKQATERFTSELLPVLPKLRSQVIHNDLNPYNILVSGDTITGIIDFGDIVKSPVVQDLATTCAYQIMRSHDPVQAIVEVATGFHRIEPILAEELAVLPNFICARLALILVIGDHKANRDPGNAPYLLRNREAAAAALARLLKLPEAVSLDRIERELAMYPSSETLGQLAE